MGVGIGLGEECESLDCTISSSIWVIGALENKSFFPVKVCANQHFANIQAVCHVNHFYAIFSQPRVAMVYKIDQLVFMAYEGVYH